MQLKPDPIGSNCWAEIDLGALTRNARRLGSIGPALMAVVKANAYGHGIHLVGPALARDGVRHFGVATAAEGAELRGFIGANASIYIMTATSESDSETVALCDLIPFVSSARAIRALGHAANGIGRIIRIHLEADTGIGRAGLLPADFAEAMRTAASTPGVELTGICTHFTWGENQVDAARQHAEFERLLSTIPIKQLAALTIHAANSPAMLNVPGARYAMVRPGLLLYGIAPTGGQAPQTPSGDVLEPVLNLRARVLLVRRLPAGTDISYGRTYTLPSDATIATIGVGYGDGYPRRLSNIGRVLLPGGAEAPIRGRVCMDQICVEIPEGAQVREGDAATLIGRSAGVELRAADIAEAIGATPHEIVACLTGRVGRLAIRGTS